jgi:hypothetical protein
MPAKDIAAADAVKMFASQKIQVNVAKRIKVRDKDTGATKESFQTAVADLAPAHVISAADFGDRVVIVTRDGQKYEAAAK